MELELINSHFREVYVRKSGGPFTYMNCYFKNITSISTSMGSQLQLAFVPPIHTYQKQSSQDGKKLNTGHGKWIIGKWTFDKVELDGNLSKSHYDDHGHFYSTSESFEYNLISKQQYLYFLQNVGYLDNGYNNTNRFGNPLEPASISTVNSFLGIYRLYGRLPIGGKSLYSFLEVQFGDSGKLKLINIDRKKHEVLISQGFDGVSDLYNPFPGKTIGRLYKSMTNGKSPNQDYTVAQKESITSRTLSEFTVDDILYGIYWISNKKFTKTHENQRLDE